MKVRKRLVMGLTVALALVVISFKAESADREEETLRILVPKIVDA